MDSYNFKQNLLQELMLLPYANYHDKQLYVRCPHCGDSVKNHDSTHFSIRIVPEDNETLVCRCLRCDYSGVFNATEMAMLGTGSNSINTDIERYNRLSNKKQGLNPVKNNKSLNLKLPPLEINDKVMEKHQYIEKRLGINVPIEELHQKKVIYDFVKFLQFNNIKKLNGSLEWIKALQLDHVGFLTTKNDFINFRDMTGNHKRYYIYKILKSIDTTGKFYVMPNKVNPFTEDNITINLAEGIFDIFGIYYHLFEKHENNMLYSSINGAGYLNVIKYIISRGIICNVNINIFSDADRNPEYYKNMIKQISPFVNDIRLFYNDIGKDYGVPINEIKLKEKDITYIR